VLFWLTWVLTMLTLLVLVAIFALAAAPHITQEALHAMACNAHPYEVRDVPGQGFWLMLASLAIAFLTLLGLWHRR